MTMIPPAPIQLPVILILPTTSSRSKGEFWLIPTLPSWVMRSRSVSVLEPPAQPGRMPAVGQRIDRECLFLGQRGVAAGAAAAHSAAAG
jgi:hypothetical protein